jgi:hypothetical protein
MHGGGEGFYSPITGDRSKGFTRQPLYYGMKLAQQFAGATMLESSLAAGSANVTAFAATKSNGLLLAVINKGGEPLDLEIKRSSLRNMQLRSAGKAMCSRYRQPLRYRFCQRCRRAATSTWQRRHRVTGSLFRTGPPIQPDFYADTPTFLYPDGRITEHLNVVGDARYS